MTLQYLQNRGCYGHFNFFNALLIWAYDSLRRRSRFGRLRTESLTSRQHNGVGVVEQQLHNGGMPALSRLDEHRGVVLELAERVRVAREQELDDVRVSARARQRQRRVVAVRRHTVHVRALKGIRIFLK